MCLARCATMRASTAPSKWAPARVARAVDYAPNALGPWARRRAGRRPSSSSFWPARVRRVGAGVRRRSCSPQVADDGVMGRQRVLPAVRRAERRSLGAIRRRSTRTPTRYGSSTAHLGRVHRSRWTTCWCRTCSSAPAASMRVIGTLCRIAGFVPSSSRTVLPLVVLYLALHAYSAPATRDLQRLEATSRSSTRCSSTRQTTLAVLADDPRVRRAISASPRRRGARRREHARSSSSRAVAVGVAASTAGLVDHRPRRACDRGDVAARVPHQPSRPRRRRISCARDWTASALPEARRREHI